MHTLPSGMRPEQAIHVLDPDGMAPLLFTMLEGTYSQETLIYAFNRVCDQRIDKKRQDPSFVFSLDWYRQAMEDVLVSSKFSYHMVQNDTIRAFMDMYASHLEGDDHDSIVEDVNTLFEQKQDLFRSLDQELVVDALYALLKAQGRSSKI